MRLFVALDFPNSVREALDKLMARLKPLCRGARWVRTESMHATLKFIGETDAKKLDAIRATLAPLRSAEAVEMHFRGVGFFPNERRPRVAWCGVEATPNLAVLVEDIEHALESLGYAREARPFVPHLTLARFSSPQGLDKIVRAAEELKSYDFGSTRETQFHLYESILKPSGAVYRRLATFPFIEGAK